MTLPDGQKHWELGELQTLVGGYIQILVCRDGQNLIVNEESKLKPRAEWQVNGAATARYIYGEHDPIIGVALICTRLELNGPDDEDDDYDEDDEMEVG
jgi:hypothetical protein